MIAYAAALTVLFAVPLTRLLQHAAGNALHSHILLVPCVSGYLLYERYASLPVPRRGNSAFVWGLAVAGAASAATAIMWRATFSHNDYLAAMVLAYSLFLTAGALYFQGSRWMRAAAFPFAFLLFLVPLPDAAVDAIEKGSQFASADAAAGFFHLAGTPLVRQGLRFELPNITLVVAQECSGIRSSLVLFITSIVAANLFLTSTWRRLALVLFVIPLGLVRNGFRVWVLGELCVRVGPQVLDSAIHHRGGPIFFVLSLIPFFLVLWRLRHGERKRPLLKAA